MSTEQTVLGALKRLSPTEFEHLTFDLAVMAGMRNVTWRTPGADNGRDIEGEVITTDFSGAIQFDRWYVECKRYSSSIDWPTVYGKLAYADNKNADFLLFVTTSALSPTCKSEVAEHNRRKRRPTIRHWDGAALAQRVEREPFLLAKYSLAENIDSALSAKPFIETLIRIISAAYGAAHFRGSSERELECATMLSELFLARLDPRVRGHRAFVAERDGFEWLHVEPGSNLAPLDVLGFRALVAAVRMLSRGPVTAREQDGQIIVSSTDDLPIGSDELLNTIALASNFECKVSEEGLIVELRRSQAARNSE